MQASRPAPEVAVAAAAVAVAGLPAKPFQTTLAPWLRPSSCSALVVRAAEAGAPASAAAAPTRQ